MKTLSLGSCGVVGGIILVVLVGIGVGLVSWRNSRGNKVLTKALSEPLDGATAATVDITLGAGGLTIDRLSGGEALLASGTLQYEEKQGLPTTTLESSNGQTTLALSTQDSGRSGFHFPWEACNSAAEWQIHLNPVVAADITAHTGGGNVKLDLAGMAVTHVSADTGGGNVDVTLPDHAANLDVTAKTGAGNVAVHVPGGMAARIHVTNGIGKTIVDPRFRQIDSHTYQSLDFEGAANQVEITAGSGAGNVSID